MCVLHTHTHTHSVCVTHTHTQNYPHVRAPVLTRVVSPVTQRVRILPVVPIFTPPVSLFPEGDKVPPLVVDKKYKV